MIIDPLDFKNYCKELGGKIIKLKIRRITPLVGNEWEKIETASCEFEGKEIELFPTGYEHDEGEIILDNKEVDMSFDGFNLSFLITNLKDVEKVFITANYGGKIKFSKPKKFILNQDAEIKLVD
jgi:hypothetical protein